MWESNPRSKPNLRRIESAKIWARGASILRWRGGGKKREKKREKEKKKEKKRGKKKEKRKRRERKIEENLQEVILNL